MLPELPDFTNPRTLTLADLQAVVTWLRRLRPLVGGEVTPFVTANGTFWMGGGGGGGSKLAYTGPGGISGATFDGTDLTPLSANVTLFVRTGTGWTLTDGPIVEVFNVSTGAVGGDEVILIRRVDGRWVVDWEEC